MGGIPWMDRGTAMNRIRLAKSVAAIATAALALTACSAPGPELLRADGVERVSLQRSEYDADTRALRNSAFVLGNALLENGGDGSDGNTVSSPGSLLIALAMLRSGASGETAAELDQVLGWTELRRDEAMNVLLAALEEFDGDPGSVDEDNPPRHPVLHAANGLFVDRSVTTGPEYLATLARHYGTGVYPVDFTDEAATKPAIDAWVDKNTGGRIKKAPAEYDVKNTFSLLNALYFAAAWKSPFDPNKTFDSPFTKAGGEEIMVPSMHNEFTMTYAEGNGWRGVDLPYADGFVMRLVLPDKAAAADPQTGTATFGAAKLTDIAETFVGAGQETVQIQLPTWDHKTNFDLRDVMAGLGLNTTLSTTSDFDAIQHGLTLTQAAQAANITVAEKGTVAAAVTQINGMVTSAPPPPARTIEFDRAFHYQILHVETGLPLFMGTVADPR